MNWNAVRADHFGTSYTSFARTISIEDLAIRMKDYAFAFDHDLIRLAFLYL